MLTPMSTPMPAPEFATLTGDDLVTGEAVALELPAASIGLRIASGLIDVAVTVVVAFVVVFALGVASARLDGALQHVAIVLAMILVFLVVPTTVETLTRGKSLGKLALGLRTVRDDAGPVAAQQAFVRALVGFVEIYSLSGVPAFFTALFSKRGKRLGDYAAGTYVVRDRVRLTLQPPPVLPPALAGWARSADLSAWPVGLTVAVRHYLQRLDTLDPAARQSVGARLAEQVASYVAPAPPPGTTPWDYLAAVSAVRRERDAARLERERRMRERLTQTRR